MSLHGRMYILFILIIGQDLVTSSIRMQVQFKKCCDIGTNWAKEGLRCEKYVGPVPGVPRVEQSLCLESVDICCVRAYNGKSCDKGKQIAREGLACAESTSASSEGGRSQNNYLRDCCEGCRLGILTGSLGQGCALNGFSFGNPWDPTFLECCNEALTTTISPTTMSKNITTTSEDKTTDDSNDDDDDTTASDTKTTPLKSSSSTSSATSPSNSSTTAKPKSSSLSPNASTTTSNSSTPSNPSASSESNSTADGSSTIPTPSLDDICELLKGLLCSHICVPTPGSYYCKCPKGYILLEDEKTCRSDGPIDRCESDNPCEHRCIDTGTDVKCECDPGFKLAKDGHSCELKSTESNTTSTMMSITNTMTQKTTFSPTLASTTKAKKKSKDKKKPRCPLGYRYNLTARVCDDIDECNENPCPITNICENVIGSYVCINKNPSPTVGLFNAKFVHQDVEDHQVIKESCPPGYEWDDVVESCLDVDECIGFAESPCPANTHMCVNIQGSYACHELTASKAACPAGFKFNTTTKMCQDVDECAEGLHGCLAQVEECRNTEGAYECDVQCRKGFIFSRNLGICVDINECLELRNPCRGIKSICINIPGSYQCQEPAEDAEFLDEGNMQKDYNDDEMIDNEFEASKNIEEKYIINQTSSSPVPQFSALQTFLCDPGYKHDGSLCVDVDECADGPGCQDHERCANRLGGYDCLPRCNTGWYFDPGTKQCQDVDECLLGRHDCHEDIQVCKNTNGSYVCEEISACARGYQRASNGTCIDIDECADKIHSCSMTLHQYCVNRKGSYDCVTRLPDCTDGYRYSLASQRCEDIDECITRIPCDTRLSERCVNLPGSYRCERPNPVIPTRRRPACPTGYRYDSKTRQCEDVDECAEQQNLCTKEEICYNQPGGYSCAKIPAPLPEPTTQEDVKSSSPSPASPVKCDPGMKFMRNRGCIDVDECQEIEDACTSNEECVNTIGSFICNCRIGFRRDNLTQACVDINECQLQNDCHASQRCDNTVGSYNCVRFLPCGTGYTLNAATEICEDDDECVLGSHDCGDGYHCRNTLGSYRCDKNLRNQTLTTRTPLRTPAPRSTLRPTPIPIATSTSLSTSPVPTIGSRQQEPQPGTCPSGFESGPSGLCIDIDECSRSPNPCARSPLQRCVNTIGSYRCASRIVCGPGWTLDPNTSRCVDIDECKENTHECGPGQTCENRQGGYLCSCPQGHVVGPNKDCIDIDECSMYAGKVCGSNGRCVNTPGSYQCICDEGFEKSRKGTACQDINECERNPNICQQGCVNIWGSYRCTCKSGYRISTDNRSCTDVDECEEFKENNLCVGICENTQGSYSCTCPDGYRLGIDGRTCQDIDECATGRVCRDPNEMCQNTRGGFRCNRINCPAGYHLDSHRKNRCVRSSRYCLSGDLDCFRSPSHYSYNFITFVSLFPLPPTGQLELFRMRGTHLPGSVMRFSMALVNAHAPPGVTRATESCFALRRPSPSQSVLVLTRSIPGPQEIELDLSMEIYHNTAFAGSVVAKIFIFVTQYEF